MQYRFGWTNTRWSKRFLLSSTMLALSAAPALAQTASSPASPAAAPSGTVGEVVVTADAYANTRTIAIKKDLSVVSDGISANQIGELPEFGLGDALSAVPGVSFVINNGRGEDQFMTIRGLNPDYDSVTVDGMVLPSTEETVRSVSFDVLPSVLVNQADVLKTWTVDQPSDAVGGVTALRTRSAFDHPGTFVSGHFDAAYWDATEKVHPNALSGQGDLVLSKTFGANDQFGVLALGSYYQRASNTLNTYTLPYSYYAPGSIGGASAALDQASATASNTTLKPSDNVSGLIPIPDRHRWYFYDNIRTRPGFFARADYDDHHAWKANISGGVFTFTNDENRYSQYLNRVGNATIATATTGSFAQGSGEVDYDRYVQFREIAYVNLDIAREFGPRTRLDLTANYGYGHYRQNTAEDQFLQGTSASLAFNYNLAAQTSALFTPIGSAFMNPALYSQAYHLNALDQSTSKLPQVRLDFSHNFGPSAEGFGFDAGAQHRDLNQTYSYFQNRLNPVGTAPTLAAIGTINTQVPLYNGQGQTLLLIDPTKVISYITANGASYTRNATDTLSNTVNNYALDEQIDDAYVQAGYRTKQITAILGVRYENTREKIGNYLPVPFNSTTNFQFTNTTSSYSKALPSFNISYTPIQQVILRGAVTETLARPEYSQLAQNSSATVSGAVASETISNPNLKPRDSVNYDLSAEYYPLPGVLASAAVFEKDIKNEIITLTSTQQGVLVPGYATPVTLTTTQPQNANNARVRGVEFNLVDSAFTFLPGPFAGLGFRANAAFMDFNAPYIRMSDGTLRHLVQLTASSKTVGNAALLYNFDRVSAEVSYNYTSKQPISFDTNNAVNDQWWADISTVDAQVRVRITSNLDFRAQAKNLTDSIPQKVVGISQQLNYSALQNGRAYFAGVAFHF
jgi:TonB-dependent receptor